MQEIDLRYILQFAILVPFTSPWGSRCGVEVDAKTAKVTNLVKIERKSVVVERRSIRRSPLLLRLPYPPSLSCSDQSPAYSAAERYRLWCERAALSLPKTRPRLYGPVEIDMTFKEHPGRRHFDAISGGVLGFLTARGVIDDNSGKTVRKITLAWGPSDGVVVEIRPAEPNGEPTR